MMKKSRPTATIGVAVLVGVGSTVAVASPAAASPGQCTSNRACAWFDPDYGGTFGSWTSSQSYLSGWNDVISSTYNKRTHNIGWWTNAGYSGTSMIYGPGGAGYYTWPHVAENSFSSLYFY